MTARSSAALLAPAAATLLLLLVAPLALVADESLRRFVPGHVGASFDAPLTWQNYAQLVEPAYVRYIGDTARIGALASFIALAVSYPIAFRIGNERRPSRRRAWVGFLVAMLFLSILVRVYAIDLAVGPSGFGRTLATVFGVGLNSRAYTEATVVAALVHALIPLATLSLIAPLQQLNPHLVEAAEVLGAPRWYAHLTITLPLSMRGALAAYMLAFTYCVSAFVIPMVLGKGRLLFVSNLIYSRFGEVANYPSAAAIAIVVLALSLALIYAVTRLAGNRWET